ncbi:hypothetical protein [Pseudorhodoferax sp. Leaf267]|uniref:hypothetical protein n=1 Tax=Pseudorhodoferax sp. Leaf267 TaxID=1736316 RepID=UPI0006F2C5A3|nr:hypothetical protein [Pseudorhodoferax sp. Leaf267]KQP22950.1 hypothetical protein ASF43_03395 [Pseudorhodoferax sp. Leaf267]
MKTAKPAKPATTRRTATAQRAAAPEAEPKADALLPNLTRDALGEVTETLEFMWSATQAVFGDQAKPEHAIALLPYALDALEVRRLLAEEASRQQAKTPAKR